MREVNYTESGRALLGGMYYTTDTSVEWNSGTGPRCLSYNSNPLRVLPTSGSQ